MIRFGSIFNQFLQLFLRTEFEHNVRRREPSDTPEALPYSCKKERIKSTKEPILLDDLFISMIGSDFTQGEVPPHPCPPPPRGEGWVGEDHSCSFLCNVKVYVLGAIRVYALLPIPSSLFPPRDHGRIKEF